MKKKQFTKIKFYLEENIKEIFIDYIENDHFFASIDLSNKKYNYCRS